MILYFNESNLCSGELFESKFMVPCNPETYLSHQYGKNKWRKPMKEKYFNYDSIGYFKTWPNDEWPYVIRWYDLKTGELDIEKSLWDINKYAETPVDTLPEGRL